MPPAARLTLSLVSRSATSYGDTGRFPETLEELVEKKYLRALPIDPITESSTTWQVVPAPEGYKGAVYDLHSGAQGTDRDGGKYADW